MAIGCFLTIIATFIQAFAPWHNIGCFIGGRVLIGIGQGIALSKLFSRGMRSILWDELRARKVANS